MKSTKLWGLRRCPFFVRVFVHFFCVCCEYVLSVLNHKVYQALVFAAVSVFVVGVFCVGFCEFGVVPDSRLVRRAFFTCKLAGGLKLVAPCTTPSFARMV